MISHQIKFAGLILALVIGHSARSLEKGKSEDWKNQQYLSGCTVFNWKGEPLKVFPGEFCAFGPEGLVYSGTWVGIKLYNHKQEVLWTLSRGNHHQLNWDLAHKGLLVLSPKIETIDGKKVFTDDLLHIDLKGKIINETNSMKIFKAANISREPNIVPNGHVNYGTFEIDLSHFNSFYEIDSNARSESHPAFRKGNFIVNDRDAGFFILSSDLQEVLLAFKPKHSLHAHDVQVTSEGDFIYFNNENVPSEKDANKFSAVEKYDYTKGRIKYQFTAQPKEFFYSDSCGGVQELGKDLILISTMFNGMFILNEKTGSVAYSNFEIAKGGRWPDSQPIQQVKALQMQDTLKAWGLTDSDAIAK